MQSEEQLCVLLPRLSSLGCLTRAVASGNLLVCPIAWQHKMTSNFTAQLDNDYIAPKCCAYLDVMDVLSFEQSLLEDVKGRLGQHAALCLSSSAPEVNNSNFFGVGRALHSYIKTSRVGENLGISLWPLLCLSAPQYRGLPPFLESLFEYVTTMSGRLDISAGVVEPLEGALVSNLTAPSHELRSLSLRILSAIHHQRHREESEVFNIALRIEDTPLTLETARSVSMYIRKLGSLYDSTAADVHLRKIIPYYCFGILTMPLSQIWLDAKNTLKAVCENEVGEGIFTELAFSALASHTDGETSETHSHAKPLEKITRTEYECSNLNSLERRAEKSWKDMEYAEDVIRGVFQEAHRFSPLTNPAARAQTLDVLNAVPYVAEMRSRYLVPLLLSWTSDTIDDAISLPEEDSHDPSTSSSGTIGGKWTMQEKKAMLRLFEQFKNPSVLYRSEELYQSLLDLLTSGDVEMQTHALKIIFTWKNAALRPYEENLLNLLDDARFRDEVSILTHADEKLSIIQSEHRETVIPVLLRLLYGKIIARTGSAAGRRGQESKRKAVLTTLAHFEHQELRLFVRIMLGPLDSVSLIRDAQLVEKALEIEQLSVRQQLGLVKMLANLLEILGNGLEPFVNLLLNAVLYCLIRASRGIAKATVGPDGELAADSQLSMLKAVRQVGLKCLNLLFRIFPKFKWQDYMPTIMGGLVIPRIDRLPIDTAQAVSVMLQLFSTWSSMPETVFFLRTDDGKVLQKIADCLEVPSAKDEVKLFVLGNILQNITRLANDHMDGDKTTPTDELHRRLQAEVLGPHVDYFLTRIGALVRKSPSKELLGSGVQAISELAEFVTGSSQARNLVEVAAFLLDQPGHRINPKTKSNLLRILQHFIPQSNISDDAHLASKLFNTVSSLFGYFRDRASREILCRVLAVFGQEDNELIGIAELCADLNSFSPHSLDEPDFDRRLEAFSLINETHYSSFTMKKWRPVLFNMLYYIRDEEELSIRTNASLTLRRFIACLPVDPMCVSPAASDLVKSHLLPSLRKGALESSELVRAEYVAVMGFLVKHSYNWPEVSDMRSLLVDDDEEASFFNNILHIQQHRRLRALRRLAGDARQGHLSSTNISHFFIPLIEHFVFDKTDDESAHNLAAETILTIGALGEWLEWPQFRAMFRRYSGYMQSKPEMEKTIIKLLGAMTDALSRAAQTKQAQLLSLIVSESSIATTNDSDADAANSIQPSQVTLAATMPQQQKLCDDLMKNLVPPLTTYLHNKDESTVSLRVPVAIAIIKLLKLLPDERLSHSLPPVLTDLCHILRSRSQESRDLTRKTLAEIATLTGPAYFGFMLKELRGSLARGYQLHVLSYTVHSILVATTSTFKPGDLDYCLPQIVSVIMDDIFGTTGQEKDAEEYISKMREVKSSKSYDSMELVAKVTTLGRLSDLISPLQILLQEKLTLKLVKKIEELLRRIGVGLLRNNAIQSRDLLVFCYEVIQEAYKAGSALKSGNGKEDYRTKRYLINLKGANKNENRGSTSSYTYKLARFSIDVLRSALHKYDVLQTPSNLVGFLPIIGDAIVGSHEELQISAIRLLTTIIKVSLPELDQTALVAAAEAVRVIKASTSTNTESAQAALKLISAILRERRHVGIREIDLAYLLKRLKPDLEEPNRQGVTFNFLKAVLTRKIVVTEVYEVLDTVAAIMVTNQTRGARDLARGVYLQFLMDYPQSRDRFSKQLGFLVKNLDYQHQEGRQSVMETIHLLLSKVGHELTQEIIVTLFVPLVMVLINDNSAECREMASVLLKKVLERADEERTQTFLSLLRTWLGQNEQPLLTRAALQIYQIYFDLNGTNSDKQKVFVQARLMHIFKRNTASDGNGDWELVYFALQTATALCKLFPQSLFAVESAAFWSQVRPCLFYPHAWIKLSAAKLVGLYIADFGRANAETGLGSLPLAGTAGLVLTAEDIVQLTRASARILGVSGVSEELAAQSARNLVFLGRCMGASGLLWPTSAVQEEVSEAEQDSADEDRGSIDGPMTSPQSKSAIQYLFERLSAILRRENATTRAASLVSKTASLQLIAALSSHLSPTTLLPCLETILLPLHNLTDPSIPAPYSSDQDFVTAYKALVSTSQEIMALLQRKIGTTDFVSALSKVREGVKARREARRVKRRIEAVAEPEKVGREKKRKGEKKRDKRKERSGEERGRRRGW